MSTERRQAADGKCYKFQRFVEYYRTHALHMWTITDPQAHAHGEPNADGTAEHLAEASGAIERADSGVAQPTCEQVAHASEIMGDWLDEEERWKREQAQQGRDEEDEGKR